MIVALAGRRIDAPGSPTRRFPLENAGRVSTAIRGLFLGNSVQVVVSSAACGADLLALEQASLLGLRQRVVLPFDRERFRETSVTDRPGDWGPLYDRILDEASDNGDLVTLPLGPEDPEAYRAANRKILDEAQTLGGKLQQEVAAVLVWDGESRGADDSTQAFRDEAEKRSLRVLQIPTVGTAGAA